MLVAHIQVDTRTAGRSASGLVHAGLRLQVDGTFFPDERWTDFAVVVLSWWADAGLRLLAGDEGTALVRFMEGPFVVELEAMSAQAWQVRLIEDGQRRRVVQEAMVAATPLLDSVLEAGSQVLDLCRERGWWSPDAEALRGAILRLQRELVRSRS